MTGSFPNDLAEHGLVIVDNLCQQSFERFDAVVQDGLADILSIDFSQGAVVVPDLNEKRIETFRKLNAIADWDKLYFSMAQLYVSELLGPDLLIQRKLNLSIQLPEDKTSTLGIHADTLSGQSPFEVVVWTAFTDVFETNGMFYFDLDVSREIFNDMAVYETEGLEFLREKYWDKVKFLDMKKGQICIFSGTIFHGNIPNSTAVPRVSINCRFKNTFTPNGSRQSTDRSGGVFYRTLTQSPVSMIAREYLEREIRF